MIRVLYVNPFAQLISGADESLLDLITALVPLGVEPHVALPEGSPLAQRYASAGARVHTVRISSLKRSLRPWSLASYGFRLVRGTFGLTRLARSIGAHLIHTNMEVALDGAFAASLLRLPHVLHYRGNTRDDPRAVFDVLTRVWTGLSNQVICISQGTAEIFARRGLGSRVEAIYDAVPVELFRRARRSSSLRTELGAAPGDVLVGTVARIHPRKDLRTFIETCGRLASRLPNARFTIIGGAHDELERSYEAELHDLAAKVGIRERMVFAGPRFDMPAVMRALDIFVLCSRHEGFGRVVAEAMAAEVPCVLSNEGALVELSLHGRAGLLCAPGEPDSFADGISRVMTDQSLRASLVREGNARISTFEPSRVAQAVLGRYKLALEESPRPRA